MQPLWPLSGRTSTYPTVQFCQARSKLSHLWFEGEDLRDFRDLLGEHIAKEQAQQGDRASGIARDIGLIDQRIARLTDLLIDLSIDKSTYNERKADLLPRKRGLQDKLENDEDSTFWKIVAERFELGLDAYSGYLSGNETEKRDAVKMVSSNLIADGKQPVFPMLFPFDEIRNWSKSTNGVPYRGAVRTLMNRIADHEPHGRPAYAANSAGRELRGKAATVVNRPGNGFTQHTES